MRMAADDHIDRFAEPLDDLDDRAGDSRALIVVARGEPAFVDTAQPPSWPSSTSNVGANLNHANAIVRVRTVVLLLGSSVFLLATI
jgi:DNA-binding IclR family transcriptional regulator